jgi:cell division protein FtsB
LTTSDAAEQPQPERKPKASRGARVRSRMRLSNWQIILIALIVVGGRLVIDFSQRIVEGQQKLTEQRALEDEIDALLAEQKALEAAKAYYGSPAYVEAWAHDEGKMVREGEMLVIPLYDRPEPATPPPASGQTAQADLSPWRVWWTLFFNGEPPFSG